MTTQNQRNRRKGAAFELDVLKWVREVAGLPAERLRLTGRLDEGDVAVQDVGLTYLMEVKNCAKFEPGPWMDEAKREAANYARARGIDLASVMPLVVAKRRGHGVARSFVISEPGDFFTV